MEAKSGISQVDGAVKTFIEDFERWNCHSRKRKMMWSDIGFAQRNENWWIDEGPNMTKTRCWMKRIWETSTRQHIWRGQNQEGWERCERLVGGEEEGKRKVWVAMWTFLNHGKVNRGVQPILAGYDPTAALRILVDPQFAEAYCLHVWMMSCHLTDASCACMGEVSIPQQYY